MTTTPILIDDDNELSEGLQKGLVMLGEAESFQIVDQSSFTLAAAARKAAKAEVAHWHEFFRGIKQAQDVAKKSILDKEKQMVAGPQKAVEILDGMLVAYERAQARELAIAQARAAEEARRIEAARPKPLPGEAPLPPVVVPAVAVEIPKSDAVGFATYWKAEVVDLLALVKAAAEGKVPLFYVQANEKALNDAARSAKANLNLPGVRPVEDRRARG